MEAKHGTVMALAAAHGRIGFALFQDGQLIDWGLSEKGARSPLATYDKARSWIRMYRPDLILTEALTPQCRKGENARSLIDALVEVSRQSGADHQSVVRVQRYRNKYEEIEAISLDHPEIALWAPEPRRFYESEPRATIYFEAIALVHSFSSSQAA